MREIIFRGKRKDNGEWVYGNLITDGEDVFILVKEDLLKGLDVGGWIDGAQSYEVIPETVGQYTGLTNKNGTKIFEGDILKGLYANGNAEVEMINGSWAGYAGKGWTDIGYVVERVEVIGNAHDNPELLQD